MFVCFAERPQHQSHSASRPSTTVASKAERNMQPSYSVPQFSALVSKVPALTQSSLEERADEPKTEELTERVPSSAGTEVGIGKSSFL